MTSFKEAHRLVFDPFCKMLNSLMGESISIQEEKKTLQYLIFEGIVKSPTEEHFALFLDKLKSVEKTQTSDLRTFIKELDSMGCSLKLTSESWVQLERVLAYLDVMKKMSAQLK